MPVNTKHSAYEAMEDRWQRCRDVAAGSDAIKEKGIKYLPQPPGLDMGDYNAYKMRASDFAAAFSRTVDALCGAIFQKDIEVEAKSIEDDLVDVTLTGESLEMFALGACRDLLGVGRCGIQVEMATEGGDRPYWILWSAESIVSWRTERRGGDDVLTRVVLHETIEEPDPKDPFAFKQIEQYRVLLLGPDEEGQGEFYQQQVWRKKSDSDAQWELVETVVPTRRADSLEFIPFAFVNATSVTPEVCNPPLLGLADVILSHYRSSADREHALFYVSMPTPWVVGAKGDEPLRIGSSVAWTLSENGKAGMLEHSGSGIGAIQEAMEEKKEQMAILAGRMLEPQAPAAETATAVLMRHGGQNASLKTIAQILDQAHAWALRVHAWWMGTEAEPSDVEAHAEFNKDFVSIKAGPEEIKAAMLAWQAGGMSFETWYHNLVTGEWARPGVDAEEERAAILLEGGVPGFGEEEVQGE